MSGALRAFALALIVALGPLDLAAATESDPVKALAEKAGFIVQPRLYRKPAPDFELRKHDGTTFSLSRDLGGRPAIVYMFVPG